MKKVKESRLKELIFRRFVEGISEEELLQEVHSSEERELLSAMSLRDLSRSEIIESLDCDDPVLFRRILERREQLKKILNDVANERLVRRNDISVFAHGNPGFLA